MSALREALRAQILSRMLEAWETAGVGVLDVGAHYVQWAKHDAGLQVECVSNAFLEGDERLGFVQRRRLAELGFSAPEREWPNYFRRFESETDLDQAADLVVRVVEEVLDDAAVLQSAPARGHVCVVVPVGKCDSALLSTVVTTMHGPTSVRRDTTVINAYRPGLIADRDGPDLQGWLAEPHRELQPERLSLFFSDPRAGSLRMAADLIEACGRLRDQGRHVIVVGPYYLPGDWLYNGVVHELADGIVALADQNGVDLLRTELPALLSGRAFSALVGYGEKQPHLAHVEVACHLEDAEAACHFQPTYAQALGLWELCAGAVRPS